jgi:hypothetical protein
MKVKNAWGECVEQKTAKTERKNIRGKRTKTWLALLVQELPGSHLGPETGRPSSFFFRGFLQPLQSNAWIVH